MAGRVPGHEHAAPLDLVANALRQKAVINDVSEDLADLRD